MPELQKPLPVYSCAVKSSHGNHTGHWRAFTPYREAKLSPCQESCPCGSEIPAWLAAVKQEQWEKAWLIMKKTNPFPAITGQVCYRYCRENCFRGQLDQPVAIAGIEQEIGNWHHRHFSLPPKPASDCKVAIVGSGPAGLSCAYYLRQQGLQVTIYERATVPGGMLALTIPSYRFPRWILDRELEALTRDGVEFRLNCRLDPEAITGQLLAEYQAVFLATGASGSRFPEISGLDLEGVWTALDFLEKINLGKRVELTDPVIVIGGGNTALDAARMALRQGGISEVTVVYHRKRADMAAHFTEIEAAEEEGVAFIFDTELEAVCGGEKVEQVVFSPVDKGAFRASFSGRRRCGTLIMATGQQPDKKLTGLCKQNRSLFAGGDQLTGPSSIPAAIADGRRGAGKILEFLLGKEPEPRHLPKNRTLFSDLHHNTWPVFSPQPRFDHPVQEAGRCLGCGNCNYCGACALFCPEVAVFRDEEEYVVNLDYCKGCGICAQVCPSGVLEMRGVADVR